MSDESPVGPRHRWRTTLLADTLLGAMDRGAGADEPLLLDAGCGTGSLSLGLAERGRSVLAFDRDPARVRETLERARAAGVDRGLRAFVADVQALPLRDASVHAAAAGEVLEHVARDDAALAEIERVLEPGGVLALTVPAGPERLGAFDRSWGHLRRYDGAGLRERLHAAGFEIDVQRAWGWPFGRVYDALIQRPALQAQAGRAGGPVRRLGRSGFLGWGWRALFEVDERLAPWAGERGSGWLAVGRKSMATSGAPGIQEH